LSDLEPSPEAGERETLLKHVALFALLLAEKGGRYQRGESPNASGMADAILEILDALPDVKLRGLNRTSIRDSVRDGLALLKK
jgi:hypothetical protein